jgi:hypothetical protein
MNVELDRGQERRLEAIARETGKPVAEVVRELVDEALETRARNGQCAGEPAEKKVPPELSLSGLAGVGKELWAGEDAEEYVKGLRSEKAVLPQGRLPREAERALPRTV